MNDREFLVVLIATNYSICHSKDVESANAIHSATCECWPWGFRLHAVSVFFGLSMTVFFSIVKDDLVVNSSLYQQELSITIKQLKPS